MLRPVSGEPAASAWNVARRAPRTAEIRPLTRRAVLAAVPLAALLTASAVAPAGAEAYSHRKSVGLPPAPAISARTLSRLRWISGVTDATPESFGTWRGTPVAIAGMFGDATVAQQLQQWQFVHSTFRGDVDLAVGGPIDRSWAQAAAGSEIPRWKAMAAVLRANWHYHTVFLRYAHEANGTWMPWSVAPSDLWAFKKVFRSFAATMRHELRGHDVKIVFAPNFGTWPYPPDSMWPGSDVVDVVGVSSYEWVPYDTPEKWASFLQSSIGPDYWLAYAKRHGKAMAFSEWGAQSPYFVKAMNGWMAAHAGQGAGQFRYDVYLNGNELVLTGDKASQYRSLHWGR